MKIFTLNTWGVSGTYEKRWPLIVSELERLQPDVFFFQEVFESKFAEMALKRFPFFSASAYPGGLFTLSRYPILKSQTVIYQRQSPLEDYSRYLLLAEVERGKTRVLLANTHLSWKPNDGDSRIGQAGELLKIVADRKLPTLAAGDFNDVPSSPAVQQLIQNGFVDLFGALHPQENAITWDNQNPYMKYHQVQLPDRRIDLVLANDAFLSRWPLKSAEIVLSRPSPEGLFPSDHYAVLVQTQ